jgi:hypothetical protein
VTTQCCIPIEYVPQYITSYHRPVDSRRNGRPPAAEAGRPSGTVSLFLWRLAACCSIGWGSLPQHQGPDLPGTSAVLVLDVSDIRR